MKGMAALSQCGRNGASVDRLLVPDNINAAQPEKNIENEAIEE